MQGLISQSSEFALFPMSVWFNFASDFRSIHREKSGARPWVLLGYYPGNLHSKTAEPYNNALMQTFRSQNSAIFKFYPLLYSFFYLFNALTLLLIIIHGMSERFMLIILPKPQD